MTNETNRVRNTKLSELQQWPEEDIKRSLSVIEKEIKDGISARHWLEGILKFRELNDDYNHYDHVKEFTVEMRECGSVKPKDKVGLIFKGQFNDD